MQCGYIHDLQTVARVDKEQAEENKKKDEPQNTPQLTEYSYIELLSLPPNIRSILIDLLKERQNNRQ